jgi:1,4-dihydroxy-2-naphthoyl-CoA synthase
MTIHYQAGDDHIVLITIDRPESRNSADLEHFKLLR